MKIERLISIIIFLLNNDQVTASELSNKFQVSKRTIYRDIIDISLAGIPILTNTGVNGGIKIDDDYKIDKTIFTEKELKAILVGLQSLASVSYSNKYQVIIDKFSENKEVNKERHFLIDLSSHYKKSLAPKILNIQEALEFENLIEFIYFNKKGNRKIIIEPYFIVFQWSSWYVYGYNIEYNNFRLYKLTRMLDVNVLDEKFVKRNITDEQLNFNDYFTDEIKVKILFDSSVKYKLIDEYGLDFFEEVDGGKLKLEVTFTNKDFLIEWVLSFGDKAELIEPIEIRNEIKNILEKTFNNYL